MTLEASWKRDFLAGYLLFGSLHEGFHILAANFLGYETTEVGYWGLFFGRFSQIPALQSAQGWEVALVRHAGWMMSVLVAMLLFFVSKKKAKNNALVQAAMVTAVEAICTDLLGYSCGGKTVFYCGNFGVILLNSAWTSTTGDYGRTALDLLEKMIQVTMMRGAQTGGVVTWTTPKNQNAVPTPVRCRVVNGKRTDLSEQLRSSLNSQVCSSGRIDRSIQCLLGHTRFATSSKATLDGTHPHQWCPPEKRRLYPLDNASIWASSTPKPIVQKVSNFITHNGDMDFFKLNGAHSDLELIQKWLVLATDHPMPSSVDSAAIAGLVDLIRTAGCFALSIRYGFLISSRNCRISVDQPLPKFSDYQELAKLFEESLIQFCSSANTCLDKIKTNPELRLSFSKIVFSNIREGFNLVDSAFTKYAFCEDRGAPDEEKAVDGDLLDLIENTVDAFFDNDLFTTTKLFMENVVGSFGLMVTSSMDAHRQICIAARGQPMSVAFYPDKDVICYGSELAAVKAGLNYDKPGGNNGNRQKELLSAFGMTQESCRFDLDDLGGEVMLLDWSSKNVQVKVHQESKSSSNLKARITPLENNELLIPLTPDKDDPILDDINSIPTALQDIQTKWKDGGLNRISAWHLGRRLRERLRHRADGSHQSSTVDILVTGCEVSLWLAEQFASDLQKSFPKLTVQATSSNKLLGIFGQDLIVPSVGFPMSAKIPDLRNSIVFIVSHSGGTFGSLAISNLLQSVTRDIFVVSSEWDTQVGKQLRSMASKDKEIFASRVFSTDIGVRPAEPCSLSVAATHQLLTQIFEYICLIVLEDNSFRQLSGAVITRQDLRVLETCNQDNIRSLERIVGKEISGKTNETEVQRELKAAGDLWADHVLENARAYIMSFIYVVATVTSGYPLITGIAIAAGLNEGYGFYITRFFDSLIYFFLPQINIIIIRLIQGRNLLHRMTGRTAVIGDIPWVAQSAEAFLSKIFARSYSIAGLNVLSGNPADHLVHRHTHRVVRGSLLVCGRPDGRLTALTSAECAVNLSVNQASSIQSLGGTCESITIGHNPAKLQLTKKDIALSTYRPRFLCEHILDFMDEETARKQHAITAHLKGNTSLGKKEGRLKKYFRLLLRQDTQDTEDDESMRLNRSSHSLKGAYLGLQQQSTRQMSQRRMSVNVSERTTNEDEAVTMDEELSKEMAVLAQMIGENVKSSEIHDIFKVMDTDGNDTIELEEFVEAYSKINEGLTEKEIEVIFRSFDVDGSGSLDFEEFEHAMTLHGTEVIRKLYHADTNRDERGLLQVEPSTEEYFGADMHNSAPEGIRSFAQAQSQHFSMELYESRVASLQRFVSLCVMFHQTGKRVQDFFPKYSFGLFGYKMERTHSIMRIATTASPISGDAVRDRMENMRLKARFQNAVHQITNSWRCKQESQMKDLKRQYDQRDKDD